MPMVLALDTVLSTLTSVFLHPESLPEDLIRFSSCLPMWLSQPLAHDMLCWVYWPAWQESTQPLSSSKPHSSLIECQWFSENIYPKDLYGQLPFIPPYQASYVRVTGTKAQQLMLKGAVIRGVFPLSTWTSQGEPNLPVLETKTDQAQLLTHQAYLVAYLHCGNLLPCKARPTTKNKQACTEDSA